MEFEFKAKKQNPIVAWFKRLSKKQKIALGVGVTLLLIIAIIVGYIVSKFSKIDTETFKDNDIVINEELDEEVGVGYTNFVLFGADSRDNDVTKDLNTDSIIIVSLNNETKEIKLVSVYRDTLLDIKNNNIQKCNSAYRRGGAKQAINMLNMNLDMNIQKYVTVNWNVVSDVIDILGGVEVNVTEAERKAMNTFIPETARVAGRTPKYIGQAGLQTLDGVQATTYARIRKGVGDDYARTGRQRLLIELALKKAIKADLGTINKLIDTVFPQISTNLTMSEILKYVKSIAKYQIGETTGFPFEKLSANLEKRGSCAYTTDLAGEVSQLHEFLFGTVDYQPSKKVKNIGYEIMDVVRTSKSSSTVDEDEEDDDEEITTEESTTTEAETTTKKEAVTTETTTEKESTTTEAETTEKEPPTTESPTVTPENPPAQEPTPPTQEPATPEQPNTPSEGGGQSNTGVNTSGEGQGVSDAGAQADADVVAAEITE